MLGWVGGFNVPIASGCPDFGARGYIYALYPLGEDEVGSDLCFLGQLSDETKFTPSIGSVCFSKGHSCKAFPILKKTK